MPTSMHTFVIAANTDWHVQRAGGLGGEGYLVAASYRLEVSGATGGDLEVKLTDRGYSETIATAAANVIPDDEVFYNATGITLAASATVATEANISDVSKQAAAYAEKNIADVSKPMCPLLMVRGDGTLVGTVQVCIRALQPTRILQ